MTVQYRKICVLGLGYIGLPTASLLGTKGYQVVGVDTDSRVVETINAGNTHINEPDLDILLKSAVQSGNLQARSVPEEADIFVIAVPTPFNGDHTPDLKYVRQATESIVPYVRAGNLVILESTSPVGTTLEVVAEGLRPSNLRIGEELFIAHCPERVLPGRILSELVENDRVIGGINEQSTQVASDFYSEFVRGEVLCTDASTAEMTKLVENTYRDVNIAFANELSVICDSLSINVWDVIKLANRHPRVRILQPGPGVGGHCIAVDPWFIVAKSPQDARLIRTAREINDAKPGWVMSRVMAKARKFREPVIACLGIAFKADVADLRESPALQIARGLRDEKIGRVVVCEPNIAQLDEFELLPLEAAIAAADIVVLLVDHRAFRKLRAADLSEKIVIDTRGCLK